ncbi:MAG TPA: NfeD family protein [Chitinophagales bacterium]|nr:NfeD family protein [Chitinophagales bacterium]
MSTVFFRFFQPLVVLLYTMLHMQLPNACAQTPNTFRKVFIFSLHEEIAKPAERKVEKALKQAREQNADCILMSLNTFGGELGAADSIRTMLLNAPVPVFVWIEQNAASAGALISIACDSIYMKRGSTIGAASVVNQSGELMPDKYQSYMRGMMRATAEQTGRDPKIAEGMVTPNGYLSDVADTGQIITLTTAEAIKHKYCNGEAATLEDVLRQTGAIDAERVNLQLSWVDHVLGFLLNPIVNSILLLLIIGGLYFELQSPGIGFALLMAVVGAVLYFAPLYLEGLAANWEILLFVVGLGLIMVELFLIPGFGVAGVSGIMLAVAGLTLSLVSNDFFDFSFTAPTQIMFSMLRVLLVLGLGLALAVVFGGSIFNSRFAKRIILTDTQENMNAYVTSTSSLNALVGKTATAETVLRPSGIVNVDGDTYDAISDGAFFNKGQTATVVEVRGNYLVVR